MSDFNQKHDPDFEQSRLSQELEDYQRSTEKRAAERRNRALSRRTLIATGWVVPIVMSVSLATPARASGGHPGKGKGVGLGNPHPGQGGGNSGKGSSNSQGNGKK